GAHDVRSEKDDRQQEQSRPHRWHTKRDSAVVKANPGGPKIARAGRPSHCMMLERCNIRATSTRRSAISSVRNISTTALPAARAGRWISWSICFGYRRGLACSTSAAARGGMVWSWRGGGLSWLELTSRAG